MSKQVGKRASACCEANASNGAAHGESCCKVAALITIDGRGQIVLPKNLRARAGIESGDKLAVISWETDGRVCCISLIKADEFGASIKGLLGPMMEEILQA